jgi:uncharacterized delta-60 repeat protein
MQAGRTRFSFGRVLVAGLMLLLTSTAQLVGQPIRLDPAFPSGSGPDNLVRRLLRQPDERILIAGLFTNVNGLPRPKLARLQPDGSTDASFSADLNGEPRHMELLADGRILVRGAFNTVDGQFRPGLARLLPDGSLDPSFNPPPLNTPSDFYNGGFAARHEGVWVTGNFTSLGSVAITQVARLRSDGGVDPGFQSPFVRTNNVSILAVQQDGKIIVTGWFEELGGKRRDNLARLNEDGTVDPTFVSPIGRTNRIVRAFLQPDGKLLVTAFAKTETGQETGHGVFFRMNSDGTLDEGFRIDLASPGLPFAVPVTEAISHADGSILLLGSFLRVNGLPRGRLARILPDGAVDPCFDYPFSDLNSGVTALPLPDQSLLIGGLIHSIQGERRDYLARLVPPPKCDSAIIGFGAAFLVVSEDAGKAVLPVVRQGGLDRDQIVTFTTRDGSARNGADYESVSGTLRFPPGERSQSILVPVKRDGLAETEEFFDIELTSASDGATFGLRKMLRVNLRDAPAGVAGAPDTNFVVQVDGPVLNALALSNGKFVLVGAFTNVHAQFCPNLTRLHSDGSRDSAFVRASPIDGEIRALAVQPDGRLLAGGDFLSIEGQWRPALARFNDDGSVDPMFSPFHSWTNQFGEAAIIVDLVTLPDGSILCGGRFPVRDTPGSRGLVKLSRDGEVDMPFFERIPLGTQVVAIRPLSDGRMVVAGAGFVNPVFRLQANGMIDLSFIQPADKSFVTFERRTVILPASDGRVWVTGEASSLMAMRDLPPAWRLAGDGAVDRGFVVATNTPLGKLEWIEQFSVSADGKMLVVGAVSGGAGEPTKLMRLHLDGSYDPSFQQGSGFIANPQGYSSVQKLIELPNGGWVVTGDFAGYNGFAQKHVVKILPENLNQPLEFNWNFTAMAAAENNPFVSLEVVRSGDASTAAAVTVRTVDGTALGGQDFEPLDLRLDFAPSEWSRSVHLRLLNDSLVEGQENLQLILTNPENGFRLGSKASLDVQITSDDASVEFVTDSITAVEEEGFVLAQLKWSGVTPAQELISVAIEPVNGAMTDLVTNLVVGPFGADLSITFSRTNWIRIPIADDAEREGREEFRMTLLPQENVVPGPKATAKLFIEDRDFSIVPARGVAGVVEALINSLEGGVYLGGDFTGVHGVPRNRVARLLPNGDVDLAFEPGIGPASRVTALAVQSDGKLLIGGSFLTVSGVPKKHLARLHSNGVLDASFDVGAGAIPEAETFVREISARPDGAIWVAGSFNQFNGWSSPMIVRLKQDGTIDASFRSSLPPWTLGYSAVNHVNALPDGNLLVAAAASLLSPPLTEADFGVLLRLTSTGAIDARFAAKNLSTIADRTMGLAVASDGSSVSGSGQTNGSKPTNVWVAIQKYRATGFRDPGFAVTNLPPMVSAASNVRQLLIQPDGKILFLASIYEQSVRRRTEFSHVTLGRLMPNGAWDPGFALVEIELSLLNSAGPFWFNAPQRGIRIPILAGSPVPTVTMALQPDGTLVLAGAFDSVAGQPMHRLARLNADGTLRSGPMQLGLSLGNTPRLHLPKEIEAPYIIETSNDLRIWNPWRTNSTPWLGFDEVIEPGAAGATSTFLRARQID